MKIKLFNKLINIINTYKKKQRLREKIKIGVELDKTSKYKDAEFLDDKKGKK